VAALDGELTLWAEIVAHFRGGKQHEDLVWYVERTAWESRGLRGLARATDALFKEALRFFYKNRGKGEEAVDVSTFFKKKGLPTEFGRFWDRASTGSRATYRSGIKKFVAAVNESLEEQAV
jgi:hypothetical protein